MGPIIRLLRPRQWVKNLFLFAALFFTPSALSADSAGIVALGFVCFCLLSSAVYVLNDYADREADRLHPKKRHRPLAAGTISPGAGLAAGGLCLAAGLGGAAALAPNFALIALAYLLLNGGYSFWLKRVAIVDVMIIAIGFVLRVVAGAELIAVSPSPWILICTGLLALFLAFAKRRDDVVQALDTEHRASLGGYNRRYLDVAMTMVLGALLVSYMIYTTDAQAMARLGSEHLYLTAPFVIAGLLRYLQITVVEERSGTPTEIVLTDRFMIAASLGWLITFAVLIYG